MPRPLRYILGVASLALCANAVALPTTNDFESFTDGELLSNQVPGLLFSNVMVLTAGVSLNEFEFPPFTQTNVITDSGGPVTIDFSAPITSISAFLTYTEAVTLHVFDATSNEVGSLASLFTNNLALSGDPGSSPNEQFSLTVAGGFTRAIFEGSATGGSLTLDNLTYPALPNGVPEPSTLALALLALTVFIPRRRLLQR